MSENIRQCKKFALCDPTAVKNNRLRKRGLGPDEIDALWKLMRQNFPFTEPDRAIQNLFNCLHLRLFCAKRNSVKRQHSAPSINFLSLLRLYIFQHGRCVYNPDIVLQLSSNGNQKKNHMLSLERLQPHKPYTVENTAFCCVQYNTSKQMTFEIMAELVQGLYRAQPIQSILEKKPRRVTNTTTIAGASFLPCKIQQSRSARKMFAQIMPSSGKARIEKFTKRHKKLVKEWTTFVNAHFENDVKLYFEFNNSKKTLILPHQLKEFLKDSTNRSSKKQKLEESAIAVIMEQKLSLLDDFDRRFLIHVDIDVDFLIAQYNKQNGRCFYSGYPLLLKPYSPFSVSIERVDNEKDYAKHNCVLVCTIMQAPRAKWTKQSFLNDHARWIANYGELVKIYEQGIEKRVQFVTSNPAKKYIALPSTSGDAKDYCLPRIVHTKVPNADGKYVCQFCEVSPLISIQGLTMHKYAFHPETILTCPDSNCRNDANCRKVRFMCVDLFLSHFIKYHQVAANVAGLHHLACCFQGCGAKYVSSDKLLSHLRKHHGQDAMYARAESIYISYNVTHICKPQTRLSATRKQLRKRPRSNENEL